MQLEFQFVKDYPEWGTLANTRSVSRDFFEKIFNEIQLKDSDFKWAKDYVRYGGFFIKQNPQLVLPHSDYWECPEREP